MPHYGYDLLGGHVQRSVGIMLALVSSVGLLIWSEALVSKPHLTRGLSKGPDEKNMTQ